ncbi:hypothetical protein Q5P01_015401 [Channa striata]|uniref:Uncharacterized protein n=1 Tax=Channa striata TaxID=64152 RepID=A0AA88MHL0_CHASR|nr:hypothetical protein Q5P01_015401 [Channa striata]
MKVPLKLNRISQWRQRRLRFLPGSPPASGEAGCLIRDTAQTTERLKHTWRHETELTRSPHLLFRREGPTQLDMRPEPAFGLMGYSRSLQQLRGEEELHSSR